MGFLDNTGLAYLWGKITTALSGKQDAPFEIPVTESDGTYSTTVTAEQIRAAKENSVFVFSGEARIKALLWFPWDEGLDMLIGTENFGNTISLVVAIVSTNSVSIRVEQTSIPTDTSDLTNGAGYITMNDVPAAVTEQTVSGWGFTKNTGTYSKPSGGIPKTDLAAAVQTSLGKADTALQQHQSLSGYATEQWVENKGYLTQHQSLAAYRTASAQDAIDAAQDAAIAAKYTKPASGIPASDIASGVIPVVPQMATDLDMEDWTSGKTVDAAVLARGFELVGTAISRKANASDIPTDNDQLGNGAGYQTASDVQTAIDAVAATKANSATGSNGAANKAVSIPMGHLDATSTATVMTATVDGITELRDGVCMWLQNGVITSASGFTLNVNNLGAKPCYNSLAAATRVTTVFNVNYTMLLIYNSTRVDGGCWDIVYGYDSNTTYTPPKLGFGYAVCTTAAATAAKTASISSYALNTGGIVSIHFNNDVPANATLNISSKGAKAMYYRGAAITAGVIKAGDTATFVYSTYYHLIAIDKDETADLTNYQTQSITDTGGYYTTDTVEGALQEIGAEIAGVLTLLGDGVIT